MMNNNNKIIAVGLLLLAGAVYATLQYLDDDLTQEEAETAAEQPDEQPLAPLVDVEGNTDEEIELVPLAPSVDAEWRLIATFHWFDPYTATDITYIFESFFNVVNGRIKPVGFPLGRAIGVAGININDGDCLETQPLEIEFSYVLAGKVVKMAKTKLIGENDFSQANETGEQVRVLEVEPKSAVIGTISLPSFARCAPDMDQEFLESLVTYWITVIPVIDLEYRRFPFAVGLHCPGAITFEGGKLTACYDLLKP